MKWNRTECRNFDGNQIMKRHLILLLPVLMLASCVNPEQEAAEKAQQDSILQAQQDSLLDMFKIELEAISSSIDEINLRNGIIEFDTTEGKVLSKETIIAKVENLDNYLATNQSKLDNLYKKMRSSNLKNKELENLVKSMQERIAERESQIDDLMKMLGDRDMQIAEIKEVVDSMRIDQIELTEDLINMDEEMHIVHYTVGEKKELLEKGVVSKEGGLLGIGASKKLDVSNLNPDVFKSTDQRDLVTVPLYSKKAELITNHPSGSYEFTENDKGEIEELRIVDRKRFWSATAYLVIEVSN